MSKTGIVAYTAEEQGAFVEVRRSYAGRQDVLKTNDWDKLVDFLTEDKGLAIHICWSLYHFSDTIFSLLPRATQRELEDNPKVFVGDAKVFTTERLLGITVARKLPVGNFYSKAETNFYSIGHWMLSDTEMPGTVRGVEQLGYELLTGLEKLGLYPDKLTSPIGLFMAQLDTEELPTIFNFNDGYLQAMEYADQMARYEWRREYKHTKKGLHHYDLTSAYPYFIADLPDTRHGVVSHLDKRKDCEWGIVKGKVMTDVKVLPIDKNANYFTTEEIAWVTNRGLGTFELEDGWFFTFTEGKPYKPIIEQLLLARQTDDAMASNLAKRIAQGMSGKLDQYNKDGTMGELYNPILAAMTRSRCRLAVGDFIYDNDLLDSLVEVRVDGVTATKKLGLPTTSNPGGWRVVEA